VEPPRDRRPPPTELVDGLVGGLVDGPSPGTNATNPSIRHPRRVRLRHNAGVELVEQLDSDAREVSRVRHAVTTALTSLGVSDDERDVVALLVSELVTNAIRHGRPPLTVRAKHTDGSVTVGVEDASSTVPVPVKDTSWDANGGRGLHLVEALADGWGVTRNGNGKRVWFRLELSSVG
jgi:anti-sigma regulatory factor (Ser/Thr protein kinase)